MLLTAIAIAHLAAACGVPSSSILRVQAHAQVESGDEAFAIHINPSGPTYKPPTESAAISLAGRLVAEGRNIDAGLMQVNSANWRSLGLSASTVFDPARNVCAGALIIARAKRAVSCAYNTGHLACSNGYPEKIAAAERALSTHRPLTQLAEKPAPPVLSFTVPASRGGLFVHYGD